MGLGNKVFTLKSGGFDLYKWSPLPNDLTKRKSSAAAAKPYFCNATSGSQGQDWISTYCYNLILNAGQQEHIAYVECDYVQ
jgi:hypothetical protein